MDVVGLSIEIIALARSVIDGIAEVKAFPSKCETLSERIKCLLPTLKVLARMKEERKKIIESQEQNLPVFSDALIQLMKVAKDAEEFTHSLQNIGSIKKFIQRNKIKGEA